MPSEKRILIVDDDGAIRTLLFTILRRRGLPVDTAKHGAEAVERLGRCRYALVLLDLMMPVMSGWELLELAETDQELGAIPVVVVSAMPAPIADPESRGGVKACLHKPVKLEQLLSLVHRYADEAH
jgi:two-component system, OmpR family, response regulator CpxR